MIKCKENVIEELEGGTEGAAQGKLHKVMRVARVEKYEYLHLIDT